TAIRTARSTSCFRGPIGVKTSKLWPENDAYLRLSRRQAVSDHGRVGRGRSHRIAASLVWRAAPNMPLNRVGLSTECRQRFRSQSAMVKNPGLVPVCLSSTANNSLIDYLRTTG